MVKFLVLGRPFWTLNHLNCIKWGVMIIFFHEFLAYKRFPRHKPAKLWIRYRMFRVYSLNLLEKYYLLKAQWWSGVRPVLNIEWLYFMWTVSFLMILGINSDCLLEVVASFDLEPPRTRQKRTTEKEMEESDRRGIWNCGILLERGQSNSWKQSAGVAAWRPHVCRVEYQEFDWLCNLMDWL